MQTLPGQWDELSEEAFDTLIAGARSQIEEKPKSIAEKAATLFSNAYEFDGNWERRTEILTALDHLTKADVARLLTTIISPEASRRIVVLLSGEPHEASQAEPTITNRSTWKTEQSYR